MNEHAISNRVLTLISTTRRGTAPRLHLTLATVNALVAEVGGDVEHGRFGSLYGYEVVLSDTDKGLVYENRACGDDDD